MTGALLDLTPLRSSRAFRRIWLGRGLSGFGGQFAVVAVLYQVWQLTGSAVWTGLVGVAQAVPLIVVGLFAGAIVDRSDRRRVFLVATTGQAGVAVLLAIQAFCWQLPAIGVLGLVAVHAAFGAGAGPAAQTFIARLLPSEQVAAGLALNRVMFQASMLIGPALGGLMVAGWGVGACYLVDAVTFGAALYAVLGLPAMRPAGQTSRAGLRGVADGLAFLATNRLVRGALLTDLATMVLSMPLSLFPVINAERFGDDPRMFGLFLSAIAAGGIAASVFAGSFTRSARLGLVMIAGSAGWGTSLVLFGLSPDPWLAFGCLIAAGAADTVAVVSRGSIVQLHTPDALLGRVVAAEQIVGQAGPDLGNLRAGLVASATSGAASVVSGGVLCLTAVAAIAATTPVLRTSQTSRPGERPSAAAKAV